MFSLFSHNSADPCFTRWESQAFNDVCYSRFIGSSEANRSSVAVPGTNTSYSCDVESHS